jgi:hypothetical protein
MTRRPVNAITSTKTLNFENLSRVRLFGSTKLGCSLISIARNGTVDHSMLKNNLVVNGNDETDAKLFIDGTRALTKSANAKRNAGQSLDREGRLTERASPNATNDANIAVPINPAEREDIEDSWSRTLSRSKKIPLLDTMTRNRILKWHRSNSRSSRVVR